MHLSKDKDSLMKQLEEKDAEMHKMQESFKQEKGKFHAQIKEARKVIESLEADKGNVFCERYSVLCTVYISNFLPFLSPLL